MLCNATTIYILFICDPSACSFIIDFGLDNGDGDIALRIAGCASANLLGRSSRVQGTWHNPETTAASPINLLVGVHFELQLLFNENYIFIGLDSMHIAKYEHRLPFSHIRTLEIRGDVGGIIIEHTSVFMVPYPIRRKSTQHFGLINEECAADPQTTSAIDKRFLPLPYYATIRCGLFKKNYSMIVKGRVSPSPTRLKVALQQSSTEWPQPDVALRLMFHFTTNTLGRPKGILVTFNTYEKDQWTGEMNCALATDLKAGMDFNLVIVREEKVFKIYVNNTHVHNYPHILNPAYVSTCLVAGDLELTEVVIKNYTSLAGTIK